MDYLSILVLAPLYVFVAIPVSFYSVWKARGAWSGRLLLDTFVARALALIQLTSSISLMVPAVFGFGYEMAGMGALLLLLFLLQRRMTPERWFIEGVPEAVAIGLIDKTLSQCELMPQRTDAGLVFREGVVLRVSFASRGGLQCCTLLWRPHSPSSRLPQFEERLRSLLAVQSRPARPWSSLAYIVVASLSMVLPAIVLTCVAQ